MFFQLFPWSQIKAEDSSRSHHVHKTTPAQSTEFNLNHHHDWCGYNWSKCWIKLYHIMDIKNMLWPRDFRYFSLPWTLKDAEPAWHNLNQWFTMSKWLHQSPLITQRVEKLVEYEHWMVMCKNRYVLQDTLLNFWFKWCSKCSPNKLVNLFHYYLEK